MNNRSLGRGIAYPGVARLHLAATFVFRTVLLGLMLTLSLPASAQQAGGPAAGRPIFVLSVASYDQLRSGFLYLARLAGQSESATQLDMLADLQVGQGIDRKKPMGAYGWVGPGPDDGTIVVLVPVADQTALLAQLDNIDGKPQRGPDGVYSAVVQNIPDPVYFRFANGYAYVTMRDKGALAERLLLGPGEVMAGHACAVGDQKMLVDYWAKGVPAEQFCRELESNVFSVTVDYSRIPAEFKDAVLEEFDLQLGIAKETDAPPFETELQKKIRLEAIDEIAQAIKTLLREGGEASERLDLDRAAGDIVLAMTIEGVPGTAMAAAIQDLGQARSLTAGLLRNDAALNGELSFGLPDKLRELFGAMLDEGRDQALADARNGKEREALARAFEAILPTFKAAELDVAFNLRGPGNSGLYGFVGGIKVKDGARLESAFREAVFPDATRPKFDVDRVGAVSIHRVTPAMDEDALRNLGTDQLFIAFRDDAVFVAGGAEGLDALKEALAAAPATGKVMDLQISVSRLAPMAREKAIGYIARSVFGDGLDSDRFRLTLEGGKALKMRIAMKTKLIEFIGRVSREVR
jgi:hypothetical protein